MKRAIAFTAFCMLVSAHALGDVFEMPMAPAPVAPQVRQVTQAATLRARSIAATVDLSDQVNISPHGDIVGVVRSLPTIVSVGRGLMAASLNVSDVAKIRSSGAARVRLHLSNVWMAPDAHIWVYGQSGDPMSVDRDVVVRDGSIWTPSVAGDSVSVEITGDGYFDVDAVGHIATAVPVPNSQSCFIDATCKSFPNQDVVSRAIALIFIVHDDDTIGACTGGLINSDSHDSYFLTANHCLSTSSEASSVEAFWDYKTTSCYGSAPQPTQTSGASLITTSDASDVTLLRMNSLPSNRILLGYTSTPPTDGATLYRLSHPGFESADGIHPQVYSTTTVSSSISACFGRPRPSYLYSTRSEGGVWHGSSGSPAVNANGQILGQLLGTCGVDDGCANPLIADGAFSASAAVLQPYLKSAAQACMPSATVACMLNNRFRVEVRYRDYSDIEQVARVKPVTGFASPNFETAFFYFGNESNIEFMIKILDQGDSQNGVPTIDLLTGVATPLGIVATVTDSKNGQQKTYTSTAGTQAGVTDFNAFVK